MKKAKYSLFHWLERNCFEKWQNKVKIKTNQTRTDVIQKIEHNLFAKQI